MDELRQYLTLITTARERGFGIDYAIGCATTALSLMPPNTAPVAQLSDEEIWEIYRSQAQTFSPVEFGRAIAARVQAGQQSDYSRLCTECAAKEVKTKKEQA